MYVRAKFVRLLDNFEVVYSVGCTRTHVQTDCELILLAVLNVVLVLVIMILFYALMYLLIDLPCVAFV